MTDLEAAAISIVDDNDTDGDETELEQAKKLSLQIGASQRHPKPRRMMG